MTFSALSQLDGLVETYGDALSALRAGAQIDVSRDVERALIVEAQAGSEDALFALVLAYAPAIRGAVKPHVPFIGADVAESEALVAVCACVNAFDMDSSDRLAAVLPLKLREVLWEARAELQPGLAVHSRSLKRFWSLLRRHSGDARAAAADCESVSLRESTFWAIYAAVSPADSLSEVVGGAGWRGYGAQRAWSDAHEKLPHALWELDRTVVVEDHLAAHHALAQLDGREHEVAVFAYGFATGEGLSDGEVAEAMSEAALPVEDFERGDRVISRVTVLRARKSGLETMREALGVV